MRLLARTDTLVSGSVTFLGKVILFSNSRETSVMVSWFQAETFEGSSNLREMSHEAGVPGVVEELGKSARLRWPVSVRA